MIKVNNLDYETAGSVSGEIINKIFRRFKEKWYVTYAYTNNQFDTFSYENTSDIQDEDTLSKLQGIIEYMKSLYVLSEDDYYKGDNKDLRAVITEINNWEMQGGLCIYFAVLFSVLCKEHYELEMNYYQGFSKYKIAHGNINTLHVFNVYDNQVFDFTYGQDSIFGIETNYIIGKLDRKARFYGFKDNEAVQLYINDILKGNKLSYEDWIKRHMKVNSYIVENREKSLF